MITSLILFKGHWNKYNLTHRLRNELSFFLLIKMEESQNETIRTFYATVLNQKPTNEVRNKGEKGIIQLI